MDEDIGEEIDREIQEIHISTKEKERIKLPWGFLFGFFGTIVLMVGIYFLYTLLLFPSQEQNTYFPLILENETLDQWANRVINEGNYSYVDKEDLLSQVEIRDVNIITEQDKEEEAILFLIPPDLKEARQEPSCLRKIADAYCSSKDSQFSGFGIASFNCFDGRVTLYRAFSEEELKECENDKLTPSQQIINICDPINATPMIAYSPYSNECGFDIYFGACQYNGSIQKGMIYYISDNGVYNEDHFELYNLKEMCDELK